VDSEQLAGLLAQQPFPGLNAHEDRLARKWLIEWFPLYDEVRFQVHVGGGVDPGEAFAENMRRMYRYNSQKRMDLVAIGPWSVCLVEIKQRIELAALGQLLGYRYLWLQEHVDPLQHVEMMALGFEAGEDVAAVMRAHGVRLVLYEGEGG
jgi:hypothetical protein